MKSFSLITLLFVAAPSSAHALSGNELLDRCESNRGGCNGYIAGVLDAMDQLNPRLICSNTGAITGRQLTDTVVNYLRANPAKRSDNAVKVIQAAITREFCR